MTPARGAGQALTYAACASAMVLVAMMADAPEWGLAASLALGAGVAIGIAVDAGRAFRSVPGWVAAIGTTVLVGAVLSLAAPSLPSGSLAALLLPGLLVLGLDWQQVSRLRGLTIAFGVLVVVAVAETGAGSYLAGMAWLALAFVTFTQLEADARHDLPAVRAATDGVQLPEVRTTDVVGTLAIAIAVAFLLALVISVPSCNRRLPDDAADRRLDDSGQTSSRGTGTDADDGRRYVPDPNGDYLIPDRGTPGSSEGTRERVPIPDERQVGPRGAPYERDDVQPDGTVWSVERDAQGDLRITVTEPDGDRRSYRYHRLPDGRIQVDEYDEDGERVRRLWWDPNGRLVDDAATNPSGTPQDRSPQDQQQDQQRKRGFTVDPRLVLAIVAVLLALAAGAWWLAKQVGRPDPPDAPPWALALVAAMADEGRRRGRPRGRAEPVPAFAAALAEGPLPDARLAPLADVLSQALFSRSQPSEEQRAWAEQTWGEILEANPRQRGRRRANLGAP